MGVLDGAISKGVRHYIGEFDQLREAKAAVMAARDKHHGEFCRHE